MSIKEKREGLGMSRIEMSRKFNIPIRTLENWDAGKSSPAEWAEMLILEKLEKMETEEKKVRLSNKENKTNKTKKVGYLVSRETWNNPMTGFNVPVQRIDFVAGRPIVGLDGEHFFLADEWEKRDGIPVTETYSAKEYRFFDFDGNEFVHPCMVG